MRACSSWRAWHPDLADAFLDALEEAEEARLTRALIKQVQTLGTRWTIRALKMDTLFATDVGADKAHMAVF